MLKITNDFISETSLKAESSERKRMNRNFHKEADDLLQRMLNAMEPGTYIRPHKHEKPDKREVFIILRGKVAFIEFDPNGKVLDHFVMDAKNGNHGIEIAPRCYHSLISLESGSVLYEIKDGPYNPETDKQFAPWAPEEGSEEAVPWLEKLTAELGLELE